MKHVNQSGEVWIFAEQEDGALADIPLELLGKGRELADRLGVPLGAVLMGNGVEPLAATLFAHGADRVHLLEYPLLARYQTATYAKTLIAAIEACQPQICLFGATPIGRDLAPTVASALRCGLTADCTDLAIGDYADPVSKETFPNLLLQVRPAFGGNIIATIVNPRDWPQMATVREGVMRPLPPDPSRTGEIVRHTCAVLDGFTPPTEILEIAKKAKGVNHKGARIIVAAGAGVGSKENVALLRDLADALGAALGGSRAACDLGLLPADCQIGQTGVTVHPALYIACGISGAVQHVSGMKDAAKIIAINTDPDAPIFQVAHYGIVGDLRTVVPMLTKAIREPSDRKADKR